MTGAAGSAGLQAHSCAAGKGRESSSCGLLHRAAHNIAFAVASGQRERNQNRSHRVSHNLILGVSLGSDIPSLLYSLGHPDQLWCGVQGTVPGCEHWMKVTGAS